MTYQIDTIVKDKVIETITTDDIRWALWCLMKAKQHCLTSIGKIYEVDNAGSKKELFW